MSVTDLNHAVRHFYNLVDVCSKVMKEFHDYWLFNITDQIVVGIVFICFRLKKYKNIVLRYSMTKAVLLRRRITQLSKNALNAQQWRLHHCKIPHKKF